MSEAERQSTRAWTEEYYDIVDHYFWAPDQIGHRSDKLLKYALLHSFVAVKAPRTTQALLYLHKGKPDRVFRGFTDWADLKERAIAELPTIQKYAFKKMSDYDREVVVATLRALPISHFTYRDLDAAVREYEARAVAVNPRGVEVRLYGGLRAELAQRGLTR